MGIGQWDAQLVIVVAIGLSVALFIIGALFKIGRRGGVTGGLGWTLITLLPVLWGSAYIFQGILDPAKAPPTVVIIPNK